MPILPFPGSAAKEEAFRPQAARIGGLLLLILGLPLAGAGTAGRALGGYLEWPPEPGGGDAPAFSWPVFAVIAALVAAALAPFLIRILGAAPRHFISRGQPFPWWGWAGVALVALSWTVAWGAPESWDGLRRQTFTPLWLGFVLVVHGLVQVRTGRALPVCHPASFLLLFPLSAAFWWTFEFLNQFASNWHYQGTGEQTGWSRFLLSSLPFATVLPAVLGVRDLLATFPRLEAGLDRMPELAAHLHRPAAAALVAGGGVGLFGIGVLPEMLFPLLWVAPLLMLVGVQELAGERSLLGVLVEGDWRPMWRAALAGLVCGFFWELWNWGSLARWEYTVPYVDRFHLFAMPALGYAGYLPFGLECVAAAVLVLRRDRDRLLEGPATDPDG
ncbi:hypothetical protein [Thiohalorhabdus methylotrophus]|uniref:Uncharacterized protein n=1 Tax=Thiohalorhabdus methylotrophus TaxID=3242694 RepID=A0ABV4TYT4_9GAMM